MSMAPEVRPVALADGRIRVVIENVAPSIDSAHASPSTAVAQPPIAAPVASMIDQVPPERALATGSSARVVSIGTTAFFAGI